LRIWRNKGVFVTFCRVVQLICSTTVYFAFMRLISALFLSLLSSTAFAQSYWQQKVDTRIEVTLDDVKHLLNGEITIDYTNNSPDTLKYIYIHLWPNAYMHDRTNFAEQMAENGETDFYFSKASKRGNISELAFTINDQSVEYFSARNIPDVARIDLPKPLAPGAKIKIATPFKVKLPDVFSRLGHTKQAYFISQWFPKPAVYDKKGWHPIPYLNYGEFYSEVGSYDVNITLPKNYVVMATGNCSDASENAWLDELSKKESPVDTLYKKSWPKSSDEIKTLHFHEDNVHDFAWFADKRWIVRMDTVVSPFSNEIVTCYAAFLPEHQKQWKRGTEYLKNTVKSYGANVGAYPYKTIKAIEGDMSAGGGMEYPTVTVIDKDAVGALKTVIIHEAGHNWFYGILATNERDHAWMDEGMNTFYEQKTLRNYYKYDTSGVKNKVDSILRSPGYAAKANSSAGTEAILYYHETGVHTDQALEQTSANFTEINYGIDVYYKTDLMMRWLEGYMGEEHFMAGMQDYYNTWKHKHPYPEDFKACMARHTDKNIDWFFASALTTDNRVDYKLKAVSKDQVTVKNKSGFSAPVYIAAYKGDSVLGNVWSAPFEETVTLQLPDSLKDWTELRIGKNIPDAKRQNSIYHRSGLFHRSRPALRPFIGLGYGEKNKMYILPSLGYNYYDGFELGLVFHNLTIPENRFRYILSPMYGFKSGSFIGAGSVSYSWYPENLFKEITLQADAKTFHYNASTLNIADPLYARYLKIAPSLNFRFNEHNLRSSVTRILTLKAYSIQEDNFKFSLDVSDSLFKPSITQQQKVYGLVRYTHKNDRTFNPFSYGAEAQINKDFVKLSAEGKLHIDYFKKGKALRLRAYAGKFIEINSTPDISRYYLNSTYTADKDYLYDGTYFGRSEQNGAAAHQINIMEGGFKVPTPLYASQIGRSDNWLVAANLSTDLPFGKLPVRLFLDIGTFEDATKLNPSGQKLLYDAGFEITLPYDIVSVYFPVVLSKDFKDYMNTMYPKKVFGNSITFRIDLNKINWMKARNVLNYLM
jgi:hypothetical protein